jgi:hypothetical protein
MNILVSLFSTAIVVAQEQDAAFFFFLVNTSGEINLVSKAYIIYILDLIASSIEKHLKVAKAKKFPMDANGTQQSVNSWMYIR